MVRGSRLVLLDFGFGLSRGGGPPGDATGWWGLSRCGSRDPGGLSRLMHFNEFMVPGPLRFLGWLGMAFVGPVAIRARMA